MYNTGPIYGICNGRQKKIPCFLSNNKTNTLFVKCSIICETKTFFNHIYFTNTLFITEQKMVLAFILSSVSVSRNIALRRIVCFFFLLSTSLYNLQITFGILSTKNESYISVVCICMYTATDFIQKVPGVYEMQFYMLQIEKVVF